MMTKEITMTINRYKIRFSNDLTKKNDVICFDYIYDLPPGYSAISLEGLYENREKGYVDIIKKMLMSIGGSRDEFAIFYYNEPPYTVEDNKVNRYKGYWGLKAYNVHSYDFLTCKSEFLFDVDNRLKMKGVAKLNEKELEMLIDEVSYHDFSFFFYGDGKDLDIEEFIKNVSDIEYSQVMNYLLEKGWFVLILLGDEDVKTSEVVAISNSENIKKIQREFN